MLFFILLCRFVFHYAVFHSIMPFRISLCCFSFYYAVLYFVMLFFILLCRFVFHNAVFGSIMLFRISLCCFSLCSRHVLHDSQERFLAQRKSRKEITF
jgi:hypothetical protein